MLVEKKNYAILKLLMPFNLNSCYITTYNKGGYLPPYNVPQIWHFKSYWEKINFDLKIHIEGFF